MKKIKSPLNYTGGKYKLLDEIKNNLPEDITTFVDLFMGGYNVGANIKAESYISFEVIEDLVVLMNVLNSNSFLKINNSLNEIIIKYNLSNTFKYGYKHYNTNSSEGLAKINRDSYNLLKLDYNNNKFDNDYEKAIMFYCLIIHGFNNQIRYNKKGEFNISVGKGDYNKNIRNRLELFINRIQQQKNTFNFGSYELLDIDKLDCNSFVYIDPPYLITNAAYNENGGWTVKDEVKLYEFLDKLNNLNIKFMISNVSHHKGKINEILVNWMKKYNVIYLNFDYKNSNYQTSRESSQELIIKNY